VDQTFARCHRLTKTDEFSSVFGFRRAIRGKLLTVHYQPRPDSGNGARLGLVVAKKYLKRAVDRNHVKRIIREQFRCLRGGLPALDLVVRLTVKSAAIDPKLLAAEVIVLLNRLQQSRPGVQQ